MRTLRLSLLGTVILALLGGLGGAVLAQTSEEESVTWVTGTINCARAEEGTSVEDASVTFDFYPSRCFAKLSDPRVSGGWRGTGQQPCFKLPGEPCMIFGSAEILGPDGAWVGTISSINDATLIAFPAMFVFEGTGDYDGWTFVLFTPDVTRGSVEASGIIYQGPPAPWAETLPLTPAE
jgi:hypothetical protein